MAIFSSSNQLRSGRPMALSNPLRRLHRLLRGAEPTYDQSTIHLHRKTNAPLRRAGHHLHTALLSITVPKSVPVPAALPVPVPAALPGSQPLPVPNSHLPALPRTVPVPNLPPLPSTTTSLPLPVLAALPVSFGTAVLD